MRMNDNQGIYKARATKALDYMDYVLDEYHSSDFSEFAGRRGGDTITVRVYGKRDDDFMVTER